MCTHAECVFRITLGKRRTPEIRFSSANCLVARWHAPCTRSPAYRGRSDDLLNVLANETVNRFQSSNVPPEQKGEHMSRIGSTDGLSIIARYTSVVAIAITSTAGSLPKNVSEDELRSDQVLIEQRDDQPEGTGQKA